VRALHPDPLGELAHPAAGELERAASILQKKYRSVANTREEKAKRVRFLQSRGFSSDVIYRLIRISDDE